MNPKKQEPQDSENLNDIAKKTADNFDKKHENKDGVGPIDEEIAREKYANTQLQNRIRLMRTNVDSIFRTLKIWRNVLNQNSDAGRYAALSITSTESARHFLGKMLAEKGAEYPYSKEKPPTEISDQGEPFDVPLDTTEAIHFLRDKIEDQIVEMKIYCDQVAHLSVVDFLSQNSVLTKLIEAKCWLGEILGILAREKQTN